MKRVGSIVVLLLLSFSAVSAQRDCGDGLPCGRLPWDLPVLPELPSPTPMPTLLVTPYATNESQPTATPLPGVTPTSPSFAQCFVDNGTSDFNAGSPTGILVSDPGSLTLFPTVYEIFTGGSLPSGWSASEWVSGGTATVGSGVLSVNGARTGTTATYGSGRTLEFDATFRAVNFEHVGFVKDFDFTSPWAIISTFDGSGIYARTSDGINTLLSGVGFGSSNRYRIVWGVSSVQFYVNGTIRATHNVSLNDLMGVLISDAANDGNVLVVDNVQMSPYISNGTHTSRVYDAGSSVLWGTFQVTANTPTNTTITYQFRTGNTPTPDGSWTSFTNIIPNASASGTARYIQYQASLSTSDGAVTPQLDQIIFQCAASGGGGPAPTPTTDPNALLDTSPIVDAAATLGGILAATPGVILIDGTPVDTTTAFDDLGANAGQFFGYAQTIANDNLFGPLTPLVALSITGLIAVISLKSLTFLLPVASAFFGIIRKVVQLILDFLPL